MVRWLSDFDKFVLKSNFERRGWQEAEEGGTNWDIYWASVGTARQLFSPESLVQLSNEKLINHFPNHYELTRKDLLVKNIKRYRRQVRKSGGTYVPDIIPSTFVLPQEYAIFVDEFKKQHTNTTYILKPNSKAQGKGIFLINKPSQVRQKADGISGTAPTTSSTGICCNDNETSTNGRKITPVFLPAGTSSTRPGTSGSNSSSNGSGSSTPLRPALEHYVVSRYIDNPLLLGGKKFDLRLYVLVVSYKPLVVYLSTLGFARFCTMKFSQEVAELDNMFVHLTNVAVQKEGGSYNSSHGNKWPLADLRLYLEATRGHAATARLFQDIQELLVHTLKAVQQVMINDHRCFELYGFDVIIDDQLKPWLIEVNASPSLTTTTKADRLLKFKVISDTLDVVTPKAWNATAGSSRWQDSTSSSRAAGDQPRYPDAVGSMQLICHETVTAGSKGRAAGTRTWQAAASRSSRGPKLQQVAVPQAKVAVLDG